MCFARAPTMESAVGTGSSPSNPSLPEEVKQTDAIAYQFMSLFCNFQVAQNINLTVSTWTKTGRTFYLKNKNNESTETYHSTASS